MNFDVDSEILDIAISHYGKPNQIMKLVEELQELSEVICSMLVGESVTDTNAIYEMSRRIRANLDTARNIHPKLAGMTPEKAFEISDEIADCLLMIFQAVKILECRRLTQERIFAKEARLLERIESEEPMTSYFDEECPRLSSCSYRDSFDWKCRHNRGGDCYKWFVSAGRVHDE